MEYGKWQEIESDRPASARSEGFVCYAVMSGFYCDENYEVVGIDSAKATFTNQTCDIMWKKSPGKLFV